jgi:SAM-dependent methyltransferase
MAEAVTGATEDAGYRRFWHDVGVAFPDLGGAPSTDYYRANEERLLTEHLPDLRGCRLLKTDLWDEAKNTRILQWAHGQGARAFGLDISPPIARQARAGFPPGGLGAAVGDVRRIPFRDETFDAVYSMGTIEHFDESAQAAREIFRVLRPGGRAIIGVPNRLDPFLRPALVTLLSAAGMYGYGYEKSFSRRGLRQMLTGAGFEILDEPAILFIPGWLRMLDLACHAWARPLTRITGALVWPFVWLDRHVPTVRRHGYLLATVARRPGPQKGSSTPR